MHRITSPRHQSHISHHAAKDSKKRRGDDEPNDDGNDIFTKIAKINAKNNFKKRVVTAEINKAFRLQNALQRAKGTKELQSKIFDETQKLVKAHSKRIARGISDSSAASESSISSIDSQVVVFLIFFLCWH